MTAQGDPGLRFVLAALGLWLSPPLLILSTPAANLLDSAEPLSVTAPDAALPNDGEPV